MKFSSRACRLAFQMALKAVKMDTRDSLAFWVMGAVVLAAGMYSFGWDWQRLFLAATPFLILPVFFVWKLLFAVRPALAAEDAASSSIYQDQRLIGHVEGVEHHRDRQEIRFSELVGRVGFTRNRPFVYRNWVLEVRDFSKEVITDEGTYIDEAKCQIVGNL